MKIDKKTANNLCAMPDAKLWGKITFFSSAVGIDLSRVHMTTKKIQGIRSVLSSMEDKDFSRINELIAIYKKGR